MLTGYYEEDGDDGIRRLAIRIKFLEENTNNGGIFYVQLKEDDDFEELFRFDFQEQSWPGAISEGPYGKDADTIYSWNAVSADDFVMYIHHHAKQSKERTVMRLLGHRSSELKGSQSFWDRLKGMLPLILVILFGRPLVSLLFGDKRARRAARASASEPQSSAESTPTEAS